MENVTSASTEAGLVFETTGKKTSAEEPGVVSISTGGGGGQTGSAKNRRGGSYGPGGRFGHRRSPTTGHRRRHLTPDPNRGGEGEEGDDGNDSDISVEAPSIRSSSRDDKRQRRVSSTSDDEAELETTDGGQLKSKNKSKTKKALSAIELKKKSKRLIESESTTDDTTNPSQESVLRRRQRSNKSKESPEKRDEKTGLLPVHADAPSTGDVEGGGNKTGEAWWRLWPRAKSVEPEGKLPIRPKRTRSASRGKSDRESTDDTEKKPRAPSRGRPRSRPNSELYDESSDDFWKPKGSMEKLHSNYAEKKKQEKLRAERERKTDLVPPKQDLVKSQSPAKEKVVKQETPEEKKEEKKSKILETRKLGVPTKPPKTAEKVDVTEDDKSLVISRKISWLNLITDSRRQWKAFMTENQYEIGRIRALKNKCISDFLLLVIFCGVGAVVFRSIEGAFEQFYKCGVKRVKRDFIDNLWLRSHNLPEEDWKSLARHKLMDFENQLHTAFEAGLSSYSGQRSWSFINAFIYCLTVITTIGYGHITPSTTTGKIITIIYAVFGIPMFLILLADFGKMFTRCIKFFWAFVRRLYYTGSCRKVRRNVPQEVMKGVQIVYSITKKRRSSTLPPDGEKVSDQGDEGSGLPPNPRPLPTQAPSMGFLQTRAENESPGTPNLSTFAIDDEFNLPISVAITILLLYILSGAAVFYHWEDWGFLESFYFVFISMSTIGFGDYVPKNQMYMMASIVYLVFGLALTSMCINVVQEKLSDSIRRASAKIGATIGFQEELTLKTDEITGDEIIEEKLTVKNNASSVENETSKL